MAIIDIEKQLVLSILIFSEAVRYVLLKGCPLPSVSYVGQQRRSTELAADNIKACGHTRAGRFFPRACLSISLQQSLEIYPYDALWKRGLVGLSSRLQNQKQIVRANKWSIFLLCCLKQ